MRCACRSTSSGQDSGYQFALAVEQLLDPGAQHGPMPSLEREVAAEVEQGVLADPVSAALVAHEAVRVIDVGRVRSCVSWRAG